MLTVVAPAAQLDVRWVNWGNASTVLPLHDFCKYRHLLHMAGCSWSSRLKYLMLCKGGRPGAASWLRLVLSLVLLCTDVHTPLRAPPEAASGLRQLLVLAPPCTEGTHL